MKDVFFKVCVTAVFLVSLLTSCEKDASEVTSGGVFTGDVVLHTQAEVDEFVSNNYSSIDGDLVIDSEELVVPAHDMGGINPPSEIIKAPYEVEQEDPIIDLSKLNSVKGISGYVFIKYNTSLESLIGLEFLEEVGEGVLIHDNKNLKELNSFEKLKTIGGGLVVERNKSLLTLNGFNSLQSIGESVYIAENGINGIIGFNQLTTIKGTELIIAGNNNLLRIDAFNVLDRFEYESEYDLFKILISSNKELVVFKGLSALDTLQGEISLSSNNKLKKIEAFPNLKVIEGIWGEISVYHCELLDDFSFLESVIEVARIRLNENASLTNLDFLNKDLKIYVLNVKHNLNLYDFCALNGRADTVSSIPQLNIFGNGYNPYYNDFKEGRCSN